ncbi:hypothetical protein [Vulcanococcus sp.]|jgi:hypothetical protein|uniref:hypothetical protein n=1 Tax=Vulcanococcus sp. TaxID=2856995 RepID=UPI0037DA1268
MATFTPGIAIDPTTGEEVISFDAGHFDDGIGRNAAIARHMQSHQAQYVESPDGMVRHEWADLDPERYQRLEDDFVDPDEYRQQFDQMAITAEDQEYLKDLVGGDAAYQDLMSWASSVLVSEDINTFNTIMASGDMAQMEEAITALFDHYSSSDLEGSDDPVVAAVFDAVPNYDDILHWAANNLSDAAIAEYDSVMDSGEQDLIFQFVNQLVDYYNEAELNG